MRRIRGDRARGRQARRSRPRASWPAALAAATALLALLGPAAAAAEPVVKGSTHLRLTRELQTALRLDGVELRGIGRGRAQGRVVSLPVESGEVELDRGRGQLDHEGGFRLVAGGGAVAFTALRLDTAREGLWGRLDGDWTKIASFGFFRARRNGFGGTIGIPWLRLREAVAERLDRELGLPGLFSASRSLGTLGAGFRPQFDVAKRGSVVLSLDRMTLAKLAAAGVAPAAYEMLVLGPGQSSYAASLSDGAIYPDLRGGTATIEGGLQLGRERFSTFLTWVGLSLSLDTNTLSAETSLTTRGASKSQGTVAIASLDFSGATARVNRRTRKVRITGARALLEPAAAAQVNQSLTGKGATRPLLTAGELLGTVSLWMTGR